MQTNMGFFSSFLKISVFTVLMMGGLLAQSYATTGLFTSVKNNVDEPLKATEILPERSQVVVSKVSKQQVSNFEVASHQVSTITIVTE